MVECYELRGSALDRRLAGVVRSETPQMNITIGDPTSVSREEGTGDREILKFVMARVLDPPI